MSELAWSPVLPLFGCAAFAGMFFGGKYPTYHSAATRAELMRPKKTFVHLKANEGELWTVYVSHSSALYLKKG